MKFENALTKDFERKVKASIGKTAAQKPLHANGKKTLGKTGLSLCERLFVEDWCDRRGIRAIAKEPLALYCLQGSVYTPDFLVAFEDGVALVEVKSANALPNELRAIEAFMDASRRNPQIEFWWARQGGQSFQVGRFKGGEKCGSP